jgi:hypothetical protein
MKSEILRSGLEAVFPREGVGRVRPVGRNLLVTIITAVCTVITIVGSVIGLFFASINPRFDDINRRFDDVRGDINRIDKNIEQLGRDVGQLRREISFLEGQLTPLHVDKSASTFLLAYSPSLITLQVPEDWVDKPTSLIRQPYCADRLKAPEGYNTVDWSFGFMVTSSILQPVTITFNYTEEDLQQTGAQGGNDLVVLEWVPSQRKWIELPTTSSSETLSVQASFNEAGCFLLASKA